jgi:hypothetical protein
MVVAFLSSTLFALQGDGVQLTIRVLPPLSRFRRG